MAIPDTKQVDLAIKIFPIKICKTNVRLHEKLINLMD